MNPRRRALAPGRPSRWDKMNPRLVQHGKLAFRTMIGKPEPTRALTAACAARPRTRAAPPRRGRCRLLDPSARGAGSLRENLPAGSRIEPVRPALGRGPDAPGTGLGSGPP